MALRVFLKNGAYQEICDLNGGPSGAERFCGIYSRHFEVNYRFEWENPCFLRFLMTLRVFCRMGLIKKIVTKMAGLYLRGLYSRDYRAVSRSVA